MLGCQNEICTTQTGTVPSARGGVVAALDFFLPGLLCAGVTTKFVCMPKQEQALIKWRWRKSGRREKMINTKV
jgi:hypothetical protein